MPNDFSLVGAPLRQAGSALAAFLPEMGGSTRFLNNPVLQVLP